MRIRYVTFSSDGQILASSDEHTIKLWSVATGREIRTFSENFRLWITHIVFSPDGHILASDTDHKTIKLWEVITGRAIRTLTGHFDSVHSVAFISNEDLLATGDYSGNIKIWRRS